MTPDQLLSSLPITAEQLQQIQSLKSSLNAFEQLLQGGDPVPLASLRSALHQNAQSCIALIATFLGQPEEDVLAALLSLLSLADNDLIFSRTTIAVLAAFSAVVRPGLPHYDANR